MCAHVHDERYACGVRRLEEMCTIEEYKLGKNDLGAEYTQYVKRELVEINVRIQYLPPQVSH